jgi:hypothetical protein
MTEDEITAEIEHITDAMFLGSGGAYPRVKVKLGPETPSDTYGESVIRITRDVLRVQHKLLHISPRLRRISNSVVDIGRSRTTILRKRLRTVIMQQRRGYFWTESYLITIIMRQHGGRRIRMEPYDFAQDGYYPELERRFLELHKDAEVQRIDVFEGGTKGESADQSEPTTEARQAGRPRGHSPDIKAKMVQIRELAGEGLSDTAIAHKVGLGRVQVRDLRNEMGIPPNFTRGGKPVKQQGHT